jgi:hypothetical protein
MAELEMAERKRYGQDVKPKIKSSRNQFGILKISFNVTRIIFDVDLKQKFENLLFCRIW